MFNKEAIAAIAAHLNSRSYSSQLNALGALSNLILRKHHGSNVVYANEISTLLHSKLEDAFTLPNLNMVVDGVANTVTLNHHTFVVPEEREENRLFRYQPHNPWSVIIKDDTGAYHTIASGDRYAIPHGEVSTPFNYAAQAESHGAIRTGNLLLSHSQAFWFIETWSDFGKVIGSDIFDIPNSTVNRIFSQYIPQPDQSPLELDTEETLRNTYLNQDLTERLGLEPQPYPYSVMDLVELLLERTNEVNDLRGRVPVNTDTETEKKVTELALKIQKAMGFSELLSEVMDLPTKKRTQRALNEIIPRHLKRVIDEWATKK